MSHKLALSIQDSIVDNKFIFVNDLSVYDEVLGIKQRTLQVLPPFSDGYVTLGFPTSSHIGFSSIDLQLTKTTLEDIPDGSYKFHFSVAPNSQVFITPNYYRVAYLMNNVLSRMIEVSINCNTYVDECGNINTVKEQKMLLHVWMLLKGIQSLGRSELNIARADELYSQALRLYSRLFNLEKLKHC